AVLFVAAALAGCGGAPATPAVSPDAEAPPSATDAEADPTANTWATLDILAGQEHMSVLLDGKPIGKTPIRRHRVAAGSHEVTFVDNAGGRRTSLVSVQQGDATTVQPAM